MRHTTPPGNSKVFDYGDGYYGQHGGGDQSFRFEPQLSWLFDCPKCGYGFVSIPAPDWFQYKRTEKPTGKWVCLKCYFEFLEDIEQVETTDKIRRS